MDVFGSCDIIENIASYLSNEDSSALFSTNSIIRNAPSNNARTRYYMSIFDKEFVEAKRKNDNDALNGPPKKIQRRNTKYFNKN